MSSRHLALCNTVIIPAAVDPIAFNSFIVYFILFY